MKLIISVVVAELAGIIGAFFTTPAIAGWYATLTQPAIAPPNWVFGPVWTTLYLLMGIAAYLIWRRGFATKGVGIALTLYGVQLLLNTLWTILFFGLHSPALALIEIGILWVAIVATIFAFGRLSRPAALLLVPYLLWVSFAAYLNYSFWILN